MSRQAWKRNLQLGVGLHLRPEVVGLQHSQWGQHQLVGLAELLLLIPAEKGQLLPVLFDGWQ